MSAATSPGTGLAYGLQRVCAAWGFARSSFYAMKSRQQATAERPPAKRRGPKPSISDEALLVAIEADLEASPWEGEGHRKVWARLRVCRGIRVSRKRVLRVMRENNLLSPHRCRRRGGNPHVGEIITHAPNLMWGTDGVRVFTVDDGWGWIFTAIEHWKRRVRRLACVQARRPLRRPSADLHGACEAVCLDLRRCGAGAGLADGSRLPVSVGPLHQPDQVLGHPAVLRLRRTAPDQTASPRGSIARSRNRSSMAASTATSRSCGTPSAGSSNSTMPSGIVEKNGYLSPAQARQAWHTAMSLRPAA